MKKEGVWRIVFAVALVAILGFGFVTLTAPTAEASVSHQCPPSLFGCIFTISGPGDDGMYCCYYRCSNGSTVEYCG